MVAEAMLAVERAEEGMVVAARAEEKIHHSSRDDPQPNRRRRKRLKVTKMTFEPQAYGGPLITSPTAALIAASE
eukprot:scaffold41387_cov26-Tisochrysis_lutea.AAC.1